MRGIPSKVEVVVGDPLPLYRLEILKELIRIVALRKLADMRNSVRNGAMYWNLQTAHEVLTL